MLTFGTLFTPPGKVCNKNCTKQALNRLCGDDGRWYRNKCALRQSKFCNRTGVSEASSLEVCDTGLLLNGGKTMFMMCVLLILAIVYVSLWVCG